MSDPIAYFLTWRTYGTWLHGDERGSVDWTHNIHDTPMLAPNARREDWERRRLKHAPILLDDTAHRIVSEAIAAHGRFRHWEMYEWAVRTNHVHVIVANAGIPPDRMLLELKGWATRRLREAGCATATQHVWAEGGSKKYLWDATALNAAIAYVREGQDVPK